MAGINRNQWPECVGIRRDIQLKVLKAFITLGKDILTTEEIGDASGIHGKALGGPLGALTLLAKGRVDWIVVQRPDKKWRMNPLHKAEIDKILKKFGYI